MIFLLDRGGWSFSWKFCVILSSRFDISFGWRGVIIQLKKSCDSQLKVWYFYWMEGVEQLVGNVDWFSAPGMIILLDRGGWSFSWKFCVILSSRYDISIGWRGGDHTVGNNMWFSAPGMIFLLDRGGWSFSLKIFAILCSRYEIYIGGSGVVIFCVLRFKHHFLLNEHPLYPMEISYLDYTPFPTKWSLPSIQ